MNDGHPVMKEHGWEEEGLTGVSGIASRWRGKSNHLRQNC